LIKNWNFYFCFDLKKGLFHIVFSLLLTFLVTDYVCIELFSDNKIVAELDTEQNIEFEEILIDDWVPDLQDWIPNLKSTLNSHSVFHHLYSGFLRFSKSFRFNKKSNNPKVFILYRHLRLDC
jgi:hypothetical protein